MTYPLSLWVAGQRSSNELTLIFNTRATKMRILTETVKNFIIREQSCRNISNRTMEKGSSPCSLDVALLTSEVRHNRWTQRGQRILRSLPCVLTVLSKITPECHEMAVLSPQALCSSSSNHFPPVGVCSQQCLPISLTENCT